MLDGIKDDISFSNLSNTNLSNRWNLLQAKGLQASRERTPEEKPDEKWNPEKDAAIPKGPQNPSPPASSIPDYWSTPAFHNRGFQFYNGWRPGNQGIEVSEDPVPEHRLAPISHEISTCQAETHIRQPRSEVRMVGDTTQGSNFWETASSNNQAPPHRSEATNDDGNQGSERLYDSQAIPVINSTDALGRKVSKTRASRNLVSASQYGENPEANTPIDLTYSSNASQDNMYFNPRDAFQPYGPHYPQPHAPANPRATSQHDPHGSELNATYGLQYGSHASNVHAPINPTDLFQYGREASEANPPYASPYGSHGPQANAPINPTHPSTYGRQASEANPTYAFSYGSHGSQANAPIDRTHPSQYGRQASEAVAPTNLAYASPYGPHGSQANAPMNLTHASPYGRQTPEAVAQNNPTATFPYGLYGTPASGPIDPTYAFPYGRQGLEADMSMSRAYPLPYSRQGLEANASMNPAYPLPYGRQGLEANATINPAYPFSYGRQVSGANPSVYPPPIPPAHNPEQMDHQLLWVPRLCIKCDKPWHGFGPCLDESADQKEEPRIPAKAVETRPDTSLRSFRCGICGEHGHSRTRCPKDPAKKKVRGQKIDKCENCGRHGHKTERCGTRYLEFWNRALGRTQRENVLAAATQEPTTQSAPEPKDGGGSVDEGKRDM